MQKLKFLILIAVAFTLTLTSQGQTTQAGLPGLGKISGAVIDGDRKTIESATISLLSATDSSIVKMGVADRTGKFEFTDIPEGKYFISVSAVGHELAYSEFVVLDAAHPAVTLKTMELVPLTKSIGGVTVVAKKPLFEQKPGKTIVNVDASPTNAGLNVLELLEKSPGVSVDNDGNISLKGKQGVMILVDGKQTYLSGADLATLLKSMQSSNLDQIEIMTNPPAKYDAAGNSGIINIKTKKNIIRGTNGNMNLGYTQGQYARFNSSVNLNYRNDKLNVFGGLNAGTYQGFNRLTIGRRFYKNGLIDGSSDQVSRPHYKGTYQNIKAGVDYYFSKKTVAGFVVNGNFSNGDEDPWSKSNLRDQAGNILSKLNSQSDNNRKFAGISSNFNFKHTYDSTGREISADLDYAHYDNKSKTSLATSSYDASDNKIGTDVILNGDIPSVIDIYSGKVDYVHPFKSGLKLEAGLKTSYVETDNKVGYLRNNGSGWEEDSRSNHFVYDENINAAYAVLSKTIKKWNLIAGLRVENTNAKGHQVRNDSSFKRNYTNLFPNIGIGYEANENNQINFSYSRRINRPDYDALNPFVFFLDSLTYGQGNPYLQPQFTNNLEASYTFRRFLTATINYSLTNDIITQLLKQDTDKKITYQTRENFSKMEQYGLSVMANFPATKWWRVNIYANVFNNHYTGVYQADPVDIQFTNFMTNISNNFSLPKGWSAELSGFYRGKGVDGLLVANEMSAVNAAVAKQLFKNKGNLKFSIRDIFRTQQFSGYALYSDVDVDIKNRRDSRQFNVTFTYRFGKKNIPPARRKTGGATDEQNRVNTGGN